uniref:Uncharacterized protein n=1 Tax=Ixodes ricinus TaxID=34613 RepID=A0A6B0UNI8_IXORI
MTRKSIRGDVRHYVKLLPTFRENADIETYLSAFERLCCVHKVPTELQASLLASALAGIALKAYLDLTVTQAEDYIPSKEHFLCVIILTSRLTGVSLELLNVMIRTFALSGRPRSAALLTAG